MNELPFDSSQFRRAMGSFMTGVTVICARDNGGVPRGITANSFTSVSLSPPLILVCIAKTSSCYSVFEKCDSFSVNILSEEQKSISAKFTAKGVDRFAGVPIVTAATGAPLIDGSLTWLDCRPYDRVDAGDHMVLLGEVAALSLGDGIPLGYWGGRYFRPENEEKAMLPVV